MIRHAALVWLALAAPAAALDLSLPATARQTVERNTAPDRYNAPVGVFEEGGVAKTAVDGEVRRAAWRMDLPGLTPLQVMRPLRAQLEAAGYDIVLDCDAVACGGFDFRFATETLPGPNMYVNIRAFHFITALRGPKDAPDAVVSVLASTAAAAAYVQIIQATAVAPAAAAPSAPGPVADVPEEAGALAAQLLQQGHVVLTGLDFGSGSADLGPGPFAVLDRLAAFLEAEPGVRIALVGHTDSVGGLAPNIALSRQRARSVRQRLIGAYGVDPARVEAEGMGYLSPVASNLDPAGREANRRVEAVVLSRD